MFFLKYWFNKLFINRSVHFSQADRDAIFKDVEPDSESSLGNLPPTYFKWHDEIIRLKKERAPANEIIRACQNQIRVSERAAKIFEEEDGERGILSNTGFNTIVKELMLLREYDKAIKYAKKAKSQGWRNDWDRIILDLEQRKNSQ